MINNFDFEGVWVNTGDRIVHNGIVIKEGDNLLVNVEKTKPVKGRLNIFWNPQTNTYSFNPVNGEYSGVAECVGIKV